MSEEKRPVGRPTKYDPSFCEQVIELGKIGASKCEIAADLGIAWSTFALWEGEHDEFSEAVKAAMRLSQAWWEKKGRLATFGETEGFNATSYIFNMKNRFRDDWKDKVETESTHTIKRAITDMTDEELAAIATSGGSRTAETPEG